MRRIRIRHEPHVSYVARACSDDPPRGRTVDLAYRVLGTGPEKLVLIPGMCVSHTTWDHQLPALVKRAGHTALLLDNRDAGASSSPELGYDLSTLARDVWAVVDAVFGRAARVHLIGHSMGSMIAQRAAVLAVDDAAAAAAVAPTRVLPRVKSLALIAGHDGSLLSLLPSPQLIAAGAQLMLCAANPLATARIYMHLHFSSQHLADATRFAALHERYVDGLRPRHSGGGGDEDAKTAGAGKMEKRQTEGQDAFWRHLQAVTSHRLSDGDAAALQRLAVPKAVIYGRGDVVVAPCASRRLAARVGAQQVALCGGHFIIEEAADALNDVLLALVERGAPIGGHGPYALPEWRRPLMQRHVVANARARPLAELELIGDALDGRDGERANEQQLVKVASR